MAGELTVGEMGWSEGQIRGFVVGVPDPMARDLILAMLDEIARLTAALEGEKHRADRHHAADMHMSHRVQQLGQQLAEAQKHHNEHHEWDKRNLQQLAEAQRERDRLQQTVDSQQVWVDRWQTRAEQAEAAVARLTADLAEAHRDLETIQQDNLAQYDRATRAEAEVARLRAALAEPCFCCRDDGTLDAGCRAGCACKPLVIAALTPPEATAGERGG